MSEAYEVPQPILNSPFEEPARHWYIREGEPPELRPDRRPAVVYPPREQRHDRQVPWSVADGGHGRWCYVLAKRVTDIGRLLEAVARGGE
jgi:hypothetical protein